MIIWVGFVKLYAKFRSIEILELKKKCDITFSWFVSNESVASSARYQLINLKIFLSIIKHDC